MPTLTLELIVHTNETYGSSQELSLGLVNHVHKRIERFVYQQKIDKTAIPIAFLENQSLDSKSNLKIADRSWTIPVNSRRLVSHRAPVTKVTSNAYSSVYKDIVATNETYVDEYGKVQPLFFRHDLPENTVECELYQKVRGNKILVDSGFKIDLDNNVVYTNYHNYFSPDTGAYRLFYLVGSDADGGTFEHLLNPEPVAKEATWEDIDLVTGKLTEAYPTYSKSKSGSGYTFYFNKGDTWYIKPLERSLIQARMPAGRTPTDPWFLRFTNGDFSANVSGTVHRYYVPEFDKQPFIPAKPVKFSPYNKMIQINKSVIIATRGSLSVNPTTGLHLDLLFYDIDGVLVKALSTDTSLEGIRYNDTEVFYETDKISSWDNETGIISLGIELHRSWTIKATYFYEADDYEYTLLDLNPLSNPKVFDYSFIFYMLSDAHSEDRGIHHLIVDGGGIIVGVSQTEGHSHPNLQLLNADGSYNADTVIGMKYISELEEPTFTNLYTAGYNNTYGYGVLAEVSVVDVALKEDQFELDVRRDGAVLVEDTFDEAIRSNSRLLQSLMGYGVQGQEVPQTNVMILKAPITLLSDYGGNLSQSEAERLMKTHYPSSNAAIIEWDYPSVDISGWSEIADQISLNWTWEGPNYTYRLYRKPNQTGAWELIHSVVNPTEGTMSYTDDDVTASEVWYYEVRIVSEGVEMPGSYTVAIKVR